MLKQYCSEMSRYNLLCVAVVFGISTGVLDGYTVPPEFWTPMAEETTALPSTHKVQETFPQKTSVTDELTTLDVPGNRVTIPTRRRTINTLRSSKSTRKKTTPTTTATEPITTIPAQNTGPSEPITTTSSQRSTSREFFASTFDHRASDKKENSTAETTRHHRTEPPRRAVTTSRSEDPIITTTPAETISTTSGQTTTPEKGQCPCVQEDELEAIKAHLRKVEGFYTKAYDAKPGEAYDPTICYGFSLKEKSARDTFKQVLPKVDFDAVLQGKVLLTRAQCEKLLHFDVINVYIPRAKRLVGEQFCDFPLNVKLAVISAVYRGDMGPKTAKLIREKKWCQVAKEYLDHEGYRTAIKRGLRGIRTRMEWNAKQFETMCKPENSTETPRNQRTNTPGCTTSSSQRPTAPNPPRITTSNPQRHMSSTRKRITQRTSTQPFTTTAQWTMATEPNTTVTGRNAGPSEKMTTTSSQRSTSKEYFATTLDPIASDKKENSTAETTRHHRTEPPRRAVTTSRSEDPIITKTPAETISTTSGQTTTPEKGQCPCVQEDELEAIKAHLRKVEGFYTKAYDAKPGEAHDPTICYGFSLKEKSARDTFKQVLPKVDFDAVLQGKVRLTRAQCEKLLHFDVINVYIPRAKRLVGEQFCDFPLNVKLAVISAVYRGDMGPKTAKLIREKKWCQVAKEYLDHEGYRTAIKRGLGGIRTRMEWNAKQFETMCKPENSTETPRNQRTNTPGCTTSSSQRPTAPNPPRITTSNPQRHMSSTRKRITQRTSTQPFTTTAQWTMATEPNTTVTGRNAGPSEKMTTTSSQRSTSKEYFATTLDPIASDKKENSTAETTRHHRTEPPRRAVTTSRSEDPIITTTPAETISTTSGQTTTPEKGQCPCVQEDELEAIKAHLRKVEGFYTKAYDAKPGEAHDPTICYGFSLKEKSARDTFKQVLPKVDFDAVLQGKVRLTRAQCEKLLHFDVINVYIPRAKRLVGEQFCDFPLNVKLAVISAVYRGDMGPKTAKLIREKKWCQVAKEYLDHEGYRTAIKRGLRGIRTRMEWNAKQFQTMCKPENSTETPRNQRTNTPGCTTSSSQRPTAPNPPRITTSNPQRHMSSTRKRITQRTSTQPFTTTAQWTMATEPNTTVTGRNAGPSEKMTTTSSQRSTSKEYFATTLDPIASDKKENSTAETTRHHRTEPPRRAVTTSRSEDPIITTTPAETISTTSGQTTTPEKGQCPCVQEDELEAIKAHLRKVEGFYTKAYDAKPGEAYDPTICYGFSLKEKSARDTFKQVLPKVDFDAVLQGKVRLTRAQCEKLLHFDVINVYIPRAKRLVGEQFCDFPLNVKLAVISAVYRGDMGPKTAKLIREKKWCQVAKEYLDHEGYRTAIKRGLGGIRTRMEWNAKQFQTMCKPENSTETPRNQRTNTPGCTTSSSQRPTAPNPPRITTSNPQRHMSSTRKRITQRTSTQPFTTTAQWTMATEPNTTVTGRNAGPSEKMTTTSSQRSTSKEYFATTLDPIASDKKENSTAETTRHHRTEPPRRAVTTSRSEDPIITTTPAETISTTSGQTTTPEKGQCPCVQEDELEAIKAHLRKVEGFYTKAYDAKPGEAHDPTICYGFSLKEKSARDTFKQVLPKVDFDAVLQGKVLLTRAQCEKLLHFDVINVYIPRAKRLVGEQFCDFPLNVKLAVISAVYRGDMGPKTAKLIREKKWCQVAKEYLDHEGYRTAIKRGLGGIRTRMEWNAKQFETMCKPENSTETPRNQRTNTPGCTTSSSQRPTAPNPPRITTSNPQRHMSSTRKRITQRTSTQPFTTTAEWTMATEPNTTVTGRNARPSEKMTTTSSQRSTSKEYFATTLDPIASDKKENSTAETTRHHRTEPPRRAVTTSRSEDPIITTTPAETISTTSGQTTTPEKGQCPCVQEDELEAIKAHLRKVEGFYTKAYDAKPGEAHDSTICYGFSLKEKSARDTFKQVLPKVDFDAVLQGKVRLTRAQCEKLLHFDVINVYIPRAKRLVGEQFCDFPLNVKLAVISAVYRGDMGPKTAKLIREKKWCQVAKEYLDHEGYRTAIKRGLRGIRTRMEWNAKQFETMCKPENSTETPRNQRTNTPGFTISSSRRPTAPNPPRITTSNPQRHMSSTRKRMTQRTSTQPFTTTAQSTMATEPMTRVTGRNAGPSEPMTTTSSQRSTSRELFATTLDPIASDKKENSTAQTTSHHRTEPPRPTVTRSRSEDLITTTPAETISTTSGQTTTPEKGQCPCVEEEELEAIKAHLRKVEGFYTKTYDAKPGEAYDPTICYGFSLKEKSARDTFKQVLPKVDFDAVLQGKVRLTRAQCEKLLHFDLINVYIPRAKRLVGEQFCDFPLNVKLAVISAVYRGDMGPKTAKLIREKKWCQVAKEYLDHEGYRTAIKRGLRGIRTRMEWNAKQFETMCKPENSTETPRNQRTNTPVFTTSSSRRPTAPNPPRITTSNPQRHMSSTRKRMTQRTSTQPVTTTAQSTMATGPITTVIGRNAGPSEPMTTTSSQRSTSREFFATTLDPIASDKKENSTAQTTSHHRTEPPRPTVTRSRSEDRITTNPAETISTTSGQTTTPEKGQCPCVEEEELEAIKAHLRKVEGFYTKTYDAKPGEAYDPTICYGFSLKEKSARDTFKQVLPKVDFDAVLQGKVRLTRAQCEKLLHFDLINVYIPRAKRLVGEQFCDFPLNVKLAVISAVYRGDMGPKTAKLIREKKWCQVAKEYLDHEGYRTAIKRGLRGIRTRMEWNAKQFETMCKPENSTETPRNQRTNTPGFTTSSSRRPTAPNPPRITTSNPQRHMSSTRKRMTQRTSTQPVTTTAQSTMATGPITTVTGRNAGPSEPTTTTSSQRSTSREFFATTLDPIASDKKENSTAQTTSHHRTEPPRPTVTRSRSEDRITTTPAETISTTSGQTTTPEKGQCPCVEEEELDEIKAHLRKVEGFYTKTYDAKPGEAYDPTICYGFSLKEKSARDTFKQVLPKVDFDAVLQGKVRLTRAQCEKLLHFDLINVYIPRAKRLVGEQFCDFPLNVKLAVISAVYRGDMGPKTAKLIREKKWCQVAKEYLDHEGYRTAIKRGLRGIRTRMEWNAKQFETMCKPENSTETPRNQRTNTPGFTTSSSRRPTAPNPPRITTSNPQRHMSSTRKRMTQRTSTQPVTTTAQSTMATGPITTVTGRNAGPSEPTTTTSSQRSTSREFFATTLDPIVSDKKENSTAQTTSHHRTEPPRPTVTRSRSEDRITTTPAETISTTSGQTTTPEKGQCPCVEEEELDEIKAHLRKVEGFYTKTYDAKPGEAYDPTICYGFSLKEKSARDTFKQVLPNVDFDAVLQGKVRLTRAQCEKLLHFDLINVYIPRAKRLVGEQFCDFPLNVKLAVISAVYHGDMGPKTAKLIREKKWCQVAKEYLDHEGYRTAIKRGLRGIRTRMEWNAKQFETMCKPENSTETPRIQRTNTPGCTTSSSRRPTAPNPPRITTSNPQRHMSSTRKRLTQRTSTQPFTTTAHWTMATEPITTVTGRNAGPLELTTTSSQRSTSREFFATTLDPIASDKKDKLTTVEASRNKVTNTPRRTVSKLPIYTTSRRKRITEVIITQSFSSPPQTTTTLESTTTTTAQAWSAEPITAMPAQSTAPPEPISTKPAQTATRTVLFPGTLYLTAAPERENSTTAEATGSQRSSPSRSGVTASHPEGLITSTQSQTITHKEAITTTPAQIPTPKKDCVDDELDAFKAHLRKVEGYSSETYNAKKEPEKDLTICYGFSLGEKSAKDTFKKLLPDVNFDAVVEGRANLTRKQCEKLLHFDLINKYIPKAKRLVGEQFCDFPLNVKLAVISAVYRGDMGPKTAKLIREKKWCQVAKEYLDHEGYRTAKERGRPGIRTIMEWNAKQFETMCQQEN